MTGGYINPARKLLEHPLALLELKRSGTTTAPINVEIDLSNRCSLGCEWCHFAYTHTRGPLKGSEKPDGAIPGGDLMDATLAHSIIRQLADAGVRSVTWTGGGEPTLHPSFDQIITYTHAQGLPQGIYTHGGHITQARAEMMKQAMRWVYVSLDAADAADYSRDKGVAPKRFDAALDGIRRLVDAEGDATIGVGFLLTAENWHRHTEMMGLAKSLHADYCQFRPTIRYDGHDPAQRAEDASWMKDALPYLDALDGLPGVEVDTQRFRDYLAWTGHGYPRCNWSALQSVITPNGMVWRCVNKRERASALLGNLTDESWAEIWKRSGGACQVDNECRVMCRGHVANKTLDELMTPVAHAEFV